MEKNPNFVPPDEEDDLDVEYDNDGNPIYIPKKKVSSDVLLSYLANAIYEYFACT